MLLVGLMLVERLTSGCTEGLAILVITATLGRIVGLVGAPVSLAQLAKLLRAHFLRDSNRQPPPDEPLLGFPVPGAATTAFSFDLCLSLLHSIMSCSMFSRSASSWHGESGTVTCVRLYWFCHVIGTATSRINTRLAYPNGTFPVLVVATAMGLFFRVGRYFK
jgi:hypothetical protein